jgi:hypothetical protein
MISIYLFNEEPKNVTKKILEERGRILVTDSLINFLLLEHKTYSIDSNSNISELADLLKSELIIPYQEFLITTKNLDDFLIKINTRDLNAGRNPYAMNIAVALSKIGRLAESKRFFLRAEGDPQIIRKMASQYGINLEE